MDTNDALADQLAIYLSAYKHYIEIKSSARLLNVTIFGEALCRDIAEIVFNYEDLVNLNLSEDNYPAIDLGSTSKGHAIQVTISSSSKKIESTLDTFLEHKLEEKYSRLIFVILGNKQATYESKNIIRAAGEFSFNPDTDIYDLRDLFNILVKTADPEKFKAFNKRLQQELGSKIRPYLLGYDRPGQHLRALFEAHDVTATNAVAALKDFGVDRKIYFETTSLTEAVTKELIQYVAQQFAVSSNWIEGESDHIYCAGPDIERSTDWRRSLGGAFDFLKHIFSTDEHVTLIIPAEIEPSGFNGIKDAADRRQSGYEDFLLISHVENDFLINRYKLILSDPLSYRPAREGIFFLFLAAELIELVTGKTKYINVLATGRTNLSSCAEGDAFVVDLVRNGCRIGNHKDYIYCNQFVMHATSWLPSESLNRLQDELNDFIDQRKIHFEKMKIFNLTGANSH